MWKWIKIYHFSSPKNNSSKKSITLDINTSKNSNKSKKNYMSHNKNNISTKFSLTSQGFGKKIIYNSNLGKVGIIIKMNTMSYTKEDFKSFDILFMFWYYI